VAGRRAAQCRAPQPGLPHVRQRRQRGQEGAARAKALNSVRGGGGGAQFRDVDPPQLPDLRRAR
jgi:hypothetical protein